MPPKNGELVTRERNCDVGSRCKTVARTVVAASPTAARVDHEESEFSAVQAFIVASRLCYSTQEVGYTGKVFGFNSVAARNQMQPVFRGGRSSVG